MPAFGPIDSSATYLKNIDIQVGDIFLFFGNFHQDKDLQVIWGYLQVGEIIDNPEEQKKLWWHPHSSDNRISNKTNVIFKVAENLSFCDNKPGAGVLTYDIKKSINLKKC